MKVQKIEIDDIVQRKACPKTVLIQPRLSSPVTRISISIEGR